MRGLLVCAAEYSRCVKFPAALEMRDVCFDPAAVRSATVLMSYT